MKLKKIKKENEPTISKEIIDLINILTSFKSKEEIINKFLQELIIKDREKIISYFRENTSKNISEINNYLDDVQFFQNKNKYTVYSRYIRVSRHYSQLFYEKNLNNYEYIEFLYANKSFFYECLLLTFNI